EARPEWEVFADLAGRVVPEVAGKLCFDGTPAIRHGIAEAVPMYDGIQRLAAYGDQFQYGGPHLCADWRFPTPDGKAHFSAVSLPRLSLADGEFIVATRRGKQFNSIVHERTDALTGAGREAVLISGSDALRLGLEDGSPVVLRNEIGYFRGRATIAPVAPGSLQIHWPEGLVLIDRRVRSPEGGIPDYNAVVRLEKDEGAAPAGAGASTEASAG